MSPLRSTVNIYICSHIVFYLLWQQHPWVEAMVEACDLEQGSGGEGNGWKLVIWGWMKGDGADTHFHVTREQQRHSRGDMAYVHHGLKVDSDSRVLWGYNK